MPIHDTDTFGGLEVQKGRLFVRWHYAVDESKEGYLEPVTMFETDVEKHKGQELPEGMQQAQAAILERKCQMA